MEVRACVCVFVCVCVCVCVCVWNRVVKIRGIKTSSVESKLIFAQLFKNYILFYNNSKSPYSIPHKPTLPCVLNRTDLSHTIQSYVFLASIRRRTKWLFLLAHFIIFDWIILINFVEGWISWCLLMLVFLQSPNTFPPFSLQNLSEQSVLRNP